MEKQTGKEVICVLLRGLTRIFLLSLLLLASPDLHSRHPRPWPCSSGSGEIGPSSATESNARRAFQSVSRS